MSKYFNKSKQHNAYWEYIKNEMWRRMQKEKALQEAKLTPQSPECVNNWITYKT